MNRLFLDSPEYSENLIRAYGDYSITVTDNNPKFTVISTGLEYEGDEDSVSIVLGYYQGIFIVLPFILIPGEVKVPVYSMKSHIIKNNDVLGQVVESKQLTAFHGYFLR